MCDYGTFDVDNPVLRAFILGACPGSLDSGKPRDHLHPDCAGGPDCIESWGIRSCGGCSCSFPSARKGSNSKQMYLSLPNPFHRAGASCLWVSVSMQWEQWQAASGNFTFHQGSCHSAVVLQTQHHPVESPASQLALETQAPGQSQALKTTSQPTSCHWRPGPETSHPHLVTKVLLSQSVGQRGNPSGAVKGSLSGSPRHTCVSYSCVSSLRLLLL